MAQRRCQTERKESNATLRRLIDLVPSSSEIRRVAAALAKAAAAPAAIIRWSLWRRRHQASAALAHYRSRKYVQL